MNSLGGKFVTLKISATYRDFPNHFFREIPVNKWFYCKYDYFQSSPKLLSSISRILRNIKFCSWLALENICHICNSLYCKASHPHYCVCVKRITLCSCLCSPSRFSARHVPDFGIVNRS